MDTLTRWPVAIIFGVVTLSTAVITGLALRSLNQTFNAQPQNPTPLTIENEFTF